LNKDAVVVDFKSYGLLQMCEKEDSLFWKRLYQLQFSVEYLSFSGFDAIVLFFQVIIYLESDL
jgi:hypothetical protein